MQVKRNDNTRQDLLAELRAKKAERSLYPFGMRRRHRHVPDSSPRPGTHCVSPSETVVAKPAETPDWFECRDPSPDVSVIVPLYRSRTHVAAQVAAWVLADDGLRKEIVYVDDACPDKSWEAVLEAWTKRRAELKSPVGKVLVNNKNAGFARACNVGAAHALGRYLLFLNADVVPGSPDWIRAMVDAAKADPLVGVVGNLQTRPNGDIASAGSEWSWEKGWFAHIGEEIYKGMSLSEPFRAENVPDALLQPGRREMVTGSCMLVPRTVFMEVEGFDEGYRVGYWEDADLCMKVREHGMHVLYEPASTVVHAGGHSGVSGHPYYEHNVRRFFGKWVNNGKLSRMVSAIRPTPLP